MIIYEERLGSLYSVDEQTKEILSEVHEAAVFMDKKLGVIFSIGNKEDVVKKFNKDYEKAKGTILADDWVLLDLPKNAELLTKSLNNSGYLFSFLKKEGILPND